MSMTKDSLQVGNAAKMREALEWFWIKRSMLDFCHNNLSTKTWEDWDKVYCFLREFADKVQSALSAPARNCDLFGGDPKKLHELWWEWSGDLKNCNADGTVKFTFGEWLLKPAEAKGGAE